jgi:uncharacterized protein YukE
MSAIAMPGGDPEALEAQAARLEVAATGVADLSDGARQVTGSIRSSALWTGDAADAFSAFTGDLSQRAAAAQAPLSRIALAVRDYAGYLRAAQQKVAAYQSASLAAELSGNDAGYLGAAQIAGQQAESGIVAWQAAGDRAAAEVSTAAGQLGGVFDPQGPVQSWLGRQSVPADTLAGVPGLGGLGLMTLPGDLGPEILKTPLGDLGPEILITPPGDLGPEILITPPGDLGPEILITPPGDLGPQILKTPPAPPLPLINYSGGDGGIKGATGSVGKISQDFGYSTRDIRTAIHAIKRLASLPGNPDVVVDPSGEVYPVGQDGLAGDPIGNILDVLPEQ